MQSLKYDQQVDIYYIYTSCSDLSILKTVYLRINC